MLPECLHNTIKLIYTVFTPRLCSGIQLLEHEETLFNYYEKVNIQEAAITKGNLTLEALEKDARDLELAINEEKREIDLKKKDILLKRKLEEEITMLQIEVAKHQINPHTHPHTDT